MNNPEMMKMAQDMMGNGGMEGLLKNPQMMKMAQELQKSSNDAKHDVHARWRRWRHA